VFGDEEGIHGDQPDMHAREGGDAGAEAWTPGLVQHPEVLLVGRRRVRLSGALREEGELLAEAGRIPRYRSVERRPGGDEKAGQQVSADNPNQHEAGDVAGADVARAGRRGREEKATETEREPQHVVVPFDRRAHQIGFADGEEVAPGIDSEMQEAVDVGLHPVVEKVAPPHRQCIF
jgi:hypothetical protein